MFEERRKTQGETKMERYIEDLIRNKEFLTKMKRLKKYNEHLYDKKDEDIDFNKEIGEIITSYEKLKRRCNKLLNDGYMRTKTEISETYSLDMYEIAYIESILKPTDESIIESLKSMAELDMCKLSNLYDDEMNPENKGDEIIYLNPSKQLFLNAYPLAICVHPRASKRDVLDFIEKRWKWIEAGANFFSSSKKLKYGKRKYKQNLLDYIWDNRLLPMKELLRKIDVKFPNNGLVYIDVYNIIKLERNKRLSSLS